MSCIFRSRCSALLFNVFQGTGQSSAQAAWTASTSVAAHQPATYCRLFSTLHQHHHRLWPAAAIAQGTLSLPHTQTGLQPFGWIARLCSTSTEQKREPAKPEANKQEVFDSLELTDEKISALTDKIPQRPVGVVEGTSYTLLILAAFGVLAFILYQFVVNLILEPTALTAFNHTLEYLKSDPRITVRLGAADDIRAWGTNSESRVVRQQIPHQIYKDPYGVEHVRIQFHMKGPGGTALVNADMYKDETRTWRYTYLLLDVYTGSSSQPQRVHIVTPSHGSAGSR